jgi:hypothetical protein
VQTRVEVWSVSELKSFPKPHAAEAQPAASPRAAQASLGMPFSAAGLRSAFDARWRSLVIQAARQHINAGSSYGQASDLEQAMAPFVTPEVVLDRFHQLRAEVIAVIGDGERLANKMAAVSESARAEFQFARRMVSEERLSVVILGAEGAGKSTLIRGILHQELSPIEGNQPGTVAPVYVRYGGGPEPVFTVEFLDGRPPEKCGREKCFGYVRQRMNRDNEKRVARVIVEVNNPLLEHGLELVDMPGTGGVSDQIRIEAQSFIRKKAATVVGVADKRAYAPLVEIARDMIARDNKASFCAIVSNRPSDWFESEPDDEGRRRPLTDEEVEREIKAARAAGAADIVTALERAGLEDKPAADDLFVFSANLLFGRKGPIATPAHLNEMDRFLDRIASYVQENGLGIAVQRAARQTETALGRLSSHIEIRGNILSRLLAGDKGLLRIFKEDTAAALAHWSRHQHNEAHIKARAEAAWREFETLLTAHRAEIVREIDRLIAEIRGLSNLVPASTIRDKVAALRNANFEQVARDNSTLQSIMDRVAAELTASANGVLTKALAQLPMFEKHGDVAIELTPNDILRQAIGEIDGGGGRVLVQGVGAAGGAAAGAGLGAKGAALLMVPEPITMSIGAVLCGAAAFTALGFTLNRVLGDAREVAVRELEKMSAALIDGSAEEFETIRRYIATAVGQIGVLVDEALASRLEQLEVLMQDPGGERTRIEEDIRQLGDNQRRVTELEHRLLAVRNQALRLAEQKTPA